MQVENEAVLERLTKKSTSWQEKSSTSILQNNWASFSLKKLELPLEYTKKTKTGYSTAVDVLERTNPIAPIVLQDSEYRQIADPVDLSVFKIDFGRWEDPYPLCTGFDADRLVQRGSQPAKHSCPFGARPFIRKAFVPEEENSVLLSSTIHKSNCASWPIFREMSI